MYIINSYVMPIHINGATVVSNIKSTPVAMKARIARLKRELRLNNKASK